MRYTMLLVLILATTSALAATKFNPMTGKWEAVDDDAELRFNPMSKKPHRERWSYESPDADLEFHPMIKKEDDDQWQFTKDDDD